MRLTIHGKNQTGNWGDWYVNDSLIVIDRRRIHILNETNESQQVSGWRRVPFAKVRQSSVPVWRYASDNCHETSSFDFLINQVTPNVSGSYHSKDGRIERVQPRVLPAFDPTRAKCPSSSTWSLIRLGAKRSRKV